MSQVRNPILTSALVCALCAGGAQAQNIGEVIGSDASVTGSMALVANGAQVMSGSSIAAKDSAASVKLARGGELRVCPHSSVSLTASQGGRDLQFGMNTGAVEIHYSLAGSADTVLTPDFRILLPGPGKFEYAIASDVRGNTCVRALHGNGASLIVTEAMGEGVYQVRTGEEIVFHNGRVSETDRLVPPDCGCGPPATTAERAQTPSPQNGTARQPVPDAQPNSAPGAAPGVAEPADTPAGDANSVPASPAATATQPHLLSSATHVQVEAPFVYRANDVGPPPPITARVSLTQMPDLLIPATQPQPPAQPAGAPEQPSRAEGRKARSGVFGKLGSFFVGIFGGRHH